MRVAVFSAKPYDRQFLDRANAGAHELVYFETHLSPETAQLAHGAAAVCAFVNDDLSSTVLDRLAKEGVKLIALRSAGFNQVDLARAGAVGIAVARVPAYSPHAVAEHTIALILALNRKIHRAHNRVREGNFALDGLLGFDLAGKAVGVVGTGLIGAVVVHILAGFKCRILAHDPKANPACVKDGAIYVPLERLLRESQIVTLHCPLTPATHHLINAARLSDMSRGALLINTSRGAVIDTRAVIAALKSGRLGGLAIDVYEEEADLFFEDLSDKIIPDDLFARLLTFPNVVVTGHQAFFTAEALTAIAQTTIDNITAFEKDGRPLHAVAAAQA
jgi:D-lactate dehydrogenase